MLTNVELKEQFAEELATGSPVVFAIGTPNAKGSLPIYIAQEVKPRAYSLPGDLSDFEAQMRGFTNSGQLIRGIFPLVESAPQAIKDVMSKIGVVNDLDIQVEHGTVPGYETHTPVQTNGKWIENTDGKLVFETLKLVPAGEASHNVYAKYRYSSSQMDNDTMKAWVKETFFKEVEAVTV